MYQSIRKAVYKGSWKL